MLADLSGRVTKMEGKLCRCHEEDVKVEEVEDDDLTLELHMRPCTTLPWPLQDSSRMFLTG